MYNLDFSGTHLMCSSCHIGVTLSTKLCSCKNAIRTHYIPAGPIIVLISKCQFTQIKSKQCTILQLIQPHLHEWEKFFPQSLTSLEQNCKATSYDCCCNRLNGWGKFILNVTRKIMMVLSFIQLILELLKQHLLLVKTMSQWQSHVCEIKYRSEYNHDNAWVERAMTKSSFQS